LKLLFDQNLSPVLIEELQDVFPGSAHTEALGLARADDSSIWEYARENGFTIVSKDADFPERGVLLGSPPKVVWIRRGNCSTAEIAGIQFPIQVFFRVSPCDSVATVLCAS